MTSWVLRGTELPFGDEGEWFIDAAGRARSQPVAGAEHVPGRFVLRGLVDAHAHPAIAQGDSGPVALDAAEARATLLAWAHSGVVLARDVGSPDGLTLTLPTEDGLPRVLAAGRFLAPANRYFPQLLVRPVSDEELIDAALAEIARGASWVKIIADFPDLEAGTAPEPTYPIERIAALTTAVHAAGARVAAHSTLQDAGKLAGIGVDSIEHGPGLDEGALRLMAQTGAAWTPTLCALSMMATDETVPDGSRKRANEALDRVRSMLPLAVNLGVPVLAGTDVVGTISREVALLAQFGLAPIEALAAATTWPRRFFNEQHDDTADFVTYAHDPREDPTELARPLAVFIAGIRVR
jgi:imidazolonepropionase-like amidohydrolase